MKNTWLPALALALLLAAPAYTLGVRDGQIAWRGAAPDGWHLTGASADALPAAADRAALSQGLVFGTRAGLTRALEDFCS